MSAGLFTAYYLDARSAIDHYVITLSCDSHTFDAETGHRISAKVLQSGLALRDFLQDDDISALVGGYTLVLLTIFSLLLRQVVGLEVSTLVGLAAGFDKHGEVIDDTFLCRFLRVYMYVLTIRRAV